MFADNPPVLVDDAIDIGMNLDRAPERARRYRILLLSKRIRQVFETETGTQ